MEVDLKKKKQKNNNKKYLLRIRLWRNASLPPAACPRVTFEPRLHKSPFSPAEGPPAPQAASTPARRSPALPADAMSSQDPGTARHRGEPRVSHDAAGEADRSPAGPAAPGSQWASRRRLRPPPGQASAGAPAPQPRASRPAARVPEASARGAPGQQAEPAPAALFPNITEPGPPRPLNRAEGRRQQRGPAVPRRRPPPRLGPRGPRRSLLPLPMPSSRPGRPAARTL